MSRLHGLMVSYEWVQMSHEQEPPGHAFEPFNVNAPAWIPTTEVETSAIDQFLSRRLVNVTSTCQFFN